MPVQWGESGIYGLTFVDGVLFLQNRFTNQQAQINVPEFQPPPPLKCEDFVITKNWSARGASINRTGKLLSIPCCQVLPLSGSASAAAVGAGRLALCNGALALEDGEGVALDEVAQPSPAAASGTTTSAAPPSTSPPTPAGDEAFATPKLKKIRMVSSPAFHSLVAVALAAPSPRQVVVSSSSPSAPALREQAPPEAPPQAAATSSVAPPADPEVEASSLEADFVMPPSGGE